MHSVAHRQCADYGGTEKPINACNVTRSINRTKREKMRNDTLRFVHLHLCNVCFVFRQTPSFIAVIIYTVLHLMWTVVLPDIVNVK